MYSIQPLPDLRSFRMMHYYNVRNLKENTYAKRHFFFFFEKKTQREGGGRVLLGGNLGGRTVCSRSSSSVLKSEV